MTVFWFYVVALLVFFTIAAAIAEFIGWLYPDWLNPKDPLAEPDSRLEDAQSREGKVI